MSLGEGLEIRISKKLSDDTDADGLGNHTLRTTAFDCAGPERARRKRKKKEIYCFSSNGVFQSLVSVV